MLIYLPAVYFSALLIYAYRRNGFDISCCIIGIYLFTGICSILLYQNDPEFAGMEPSLIPAILYCSMITLVTWPFIQFNSNKPRNLKRLNLTAFNILSWLFIISFIFSLVLFKDDLLFRLALGDNIGSMRGLRTETAQSRLPGILKFLSTVSVAICSVSAVAFILFFYSVSFLKKSKLFNFLLLLSSFGCIISGIMNIDRSITFYWIINFIFIYILFQQYLSKKIKKWVSIFAGIALWMLGSYLVLMTFSRFGDKALDSVLSYMGQNYLNFCWFWDNYEAPVVNWGIFCPVTSHFFIDWGFPVSAVPFGWFVEDHVGYFVNVFYTFMGTIMLYLGQWAVIPFCIIYSIIARKTLSIHSTIGIQNFIYIFIIAIVPYDGVILYLLVDYIKAFGIIVLLVFCANIKRNGILKKIDEIKIRHLKY